MQAVAELAPEVGVKRACEELGLCRGSYYRGRKAKSQPQVPPRGSRRRSPRALSEQDRADLLEVLHSERFVDKAPAEVYATLLDEGRYMGSIRTMYRLLHSEGEVRERRNQLIHPHPARPQLCAKGPNQVWSWDITKLPGPAKWTYYYLYVMIDIFSRLVVGWMVAPCESAELAQHFIEESCRKHGIEPGQLRIHSDRGSSMTSKGVALLLAELGVTKSHSRPHVSNDNPFSESHFKTLKYCPQFPKNFEAIELARGFCGPFFQWYNHQHHHSGLGLLTPAQVHQGLSQQVLQRRAEVLRSAFEAHPERFVRGVPQPAPAPKEVWINRPEQHLQVLLPSPSIPLEAGSGGFELAPPLTPKGEAPEQASEPADRQSTPELQRSEPHAVGRTRREAGSVTERDEAGLRSGAEPAAGGTPGVVCGSPQPQPLLQDPLLGSASLVQGGPSQTG